MKELREFIGDEVILEGRLETAGVVVIRDFSDGPRVLVLFSQRGPDLPKGRMDRGELPIDAAMRETQEETGITDLRFSWGTSKMTDGRFAFFIARTDQDFRLLRNPKTGVVEHHDAMWLRFKDAIGVASRFRKPLKWARDIVMGRV